MHEREWSTRRAVPGARRTDTPRADPRIAQILRLQQTAGNRAVARMFDPFMYLPEMLGGYPEPKFAADFPPELRELFMKSFRIVKTAKEKQRPDDVTRQEYDDTSQLLADIWAGSTRMTLVGTGLEGDNSKERRQALRIATMKDVINLARTTTGRQLLGAVATAANQVTVDAYDIVYEPAANPANRNLPHDQRQDASVNYTPTDFKAGKASNAQDNIDKNERLKQHNPWVMPHRSDITLYHELVHAFHYQMGKSREKTALVREHQATMNVDKPFVDDSFGDRTVKGVPEEEYFTVGLGQFSDAKYSENKYRRERRLLGEDVPDRTSYTMKDQHGQRVRENAGL